MLQAGAGGGGNVKGRAEQLDLKEKELLAREAEIKRKEEELRKAGALVPAKNWPWCYPITHHDIAGDVSLRCAVAVSSTGRAIPSSAPACNTVDTCVAPDGTENGCSACACI